MSRKIAILSLIILGGCLTSCLEQKVNPELESYLSTMNYQDAYDFVNDGVMENTFTNYDNDENLNILGKKSQMVTFYKEKVEDTTYYYVDSLNTFEGDQVENDILKYQVTCSYNFDENTYQKIIYQNDELLSKENLSYTGGEIFYRNLFYTNNDVYYQGGFYLGDECIARVRQFEGIFKISDDKSSVTLKGEVEENGAYYEQTLIVNHLGLLISREDKVKGMQDEMYATQLIEVEYNIK